MYVRVNDMQNREVGIIGGDFTQISGKCLKEWLVKMIELLIQNPQEADPLMRLQKDLDDTKDILVNR